MVRSDSIALKILRMSSRKEEKWSFQTISRPVPRSELLRSRSSGTELGTKQSSLERVAGDTQL